MTRLLATVTAGLLVCGLAVGGQEEEQEGVRINVKEDLIEVSASQDTWWLGHGFGAVRMDRTESMTGPELQDFLCLHLLFELLVDGAAVAADRIAVTAWDGPQGATWIVAWQYDLLFTPGIHILTGTWTTMDLPCDYWVFGCNPDSMPVADELFTVLQPYSIKDGLGSGKQSHTLTLSVLP